MTEFHVGRPPEWDQDGNNVRDLKLELSAEADLTAIGDKLTRRRTTRIPITLRPCKQMQKIKAAIGKVSL